MDTPIVKEEIQVIDQDIHKLEVKAEGIVIKDAEQLNAAADILAAIKKQKKLIDDKRTSLVKPFNDAVKNLNAEFKPRITKAETLQRALEKAIREYHQEQARIAAEKKAAQEAEERRLEEEKQKKLAEAVAKDDDKALAEAAAAEEQQAVLAKQEVKEPEKKVETANTNTNLIDNWKYQVVDEKAVPEHLKSVDDKKVKAAIKAGLREMTGLRIYNEPIVSSRSK